jgi:hypothetical protein
MPEVTAERLEGWFRARYAAAAPATWNRELATLRSAVGWWHAHGWLPVGADPTTGLARRREHPNCTRALTRGQLEALWRRSDLRLRDKTLWRLLYETAARASEALNLDVGDFDLANKRARVVSKGGAVEWVHWQTPTARLLARLVAGRRSGPVFLSGRAPTRPVPAGDLDPVSGRARLSYRRAATLFQQTTGGGPADVDPAGLAGGLGDRCGAALDGGVLGATDAVKDRPDLGQQLGQVDGADAGQRGQQLGAWVAGDALGDRRLELGDGRQQGAQQLDLGADKGRQGGRRDADRRGRGRAQPGQQDR